MCPTCVPLSGQFGIWVEVYPLYQFSKFLLCYLASDPYLHRLKMNSGVHKQFYGMTFLRTEGEGKKKQWRLACPLGRRAPVNGDEGSPQNFHSWSCFIPSHSCCCCCCCCIHKTWGLGHESLERKESENMRSGN